MSNGFLEQLTSFVAMLRYAVPVIWAAQEAYAVASSRSDGLRQEGT